MSRGDFRIFARWSRTLGNLILMSRKMLLRGLIPAKSLRITDPGMGAETISYVHKQSPHRCHFSSVDLRYSVVVSWRNYPLYSVFSRPEIVARGRRVLVLDKCSGDSHSWPGLGSATRASEVAAGAGDFWSERFSAFFTLFFCLQCYRILLCSQFSCSLFSEFTRLHSHFPEFLLFTCEKLFTWIFDSPHEFFTSNLRPGKVLHRFFKFSLSFVLILAKNTRRHAKCVFTRRSFVYEWRDEKLSSLSALRSPTQTQNLTWFSSLRQFSERLEVRLLLSCSFETSWRFLLSLWGFFRRKLDAVRSRRSPA